MAKRQCDLSKGANKKKSRTGRAVKEGRFSVDWHMLQTNVWGRKMIELIIDTGGRASYFFIKNKEKSFLVVCEKSQDLPKELEKTLSTIGKKTSDIGRIYMGTGPGSYTGTRSGMAFALALKMSLAVELLAFPSPLSYLPIDEGLFAFALDSKAGTVYLLLGEISGGKASITELLPLTPIAEVKERIKTRTLITDHADFIGSIKPLLRPEIVLASVTTSYPQLPLYLRDIQ